MLKDEIANIEKQTKQIKDIRNDINEAFKNLEV